jgi:hypothetical protein
MYITFSRIFEKVVSKKIGLKLVISILPLFHVRALFQKILIRREKYLTKAIVTYVWGRGKVCRGCWWGSLREGSHWVDPDVDERIILRWIFRKWEGVVGTGWSGFRIGTGGGQL